MIRYVPFLKAKSNEMIALSELNKLIVSQLVPFFDYPKKNKDSELTEDLFKLGVAKVAKGLKKHCSNLQEFYLDNFDVDSALEVDGGCSYRHLLSCCHDLPVIPVVSIDRTDSHIRSVCDLKDVGAISHGTVAFRITHQDFESYGVVEGEIDQMLGEVFSKFSDIDLIFDCRVCLNLDLNGIASNIVEFMKKFKAKYNTRRVVVTGSSIPASIKDLLSVNEECEVVRSEIHIYQKVRNSMRDAHLIFGDYATVSPNYSEVDIIPEAMQNVTAPKLIYSFGVSHYLIRGAALRTNGFAQYFNLAATLCAKPFYRGENYSSGDSYLMKKSKRIGSNCTPSSVVKPLINAHIAFMIRDSDVCR